MCVRVCGRATAYVCLRALCKEIQKSNSGLNTETDANNTLLQVIYLIERLAAYFNSSLTGQMDSIAPDAVPLLNSESISAD